MATLTGTSRKRKDDTEPYIFICYDKYCETLCKEPYLSYQAFLEKHIFPYYITKMLSNKSLKCEDKEAGGALVAVAKKEIVNDEG